MLNDQIFESSIRSHRVLPTNPVRILTTGMIKEIVRQIKVSVHADC